MNGMDGGPRIAFVIKSVTRLSEAQLYVDDISYLRSRVAHYHEWCSWQKIRDRGDTLSNTMSESVTKISPNRCFRLRAPATTTTKPSKMKEFFWQHTGVGRKIG